MATVAALILALAQAEAAHCTTYSTSTTDLDAGRIVIELWIHPFDYVFFDVCQPNCAFSMGFYFEGNGIEALQRGDHRVDDTCHGLIEADGWVG